MKNPHVARYLQQCRECRERSKTDIRAYYGLKAVQTQLVRIRKANRLRAHIAKTDYSSLEARAFALMGGYSTRCLIIDAVQPAPRKEPVQPINWDLEQASAMDAVLSAITPGKFLAAMAECGKTPTGRIERKFEPVLHRLPSVTQVLHDSEGQPFGLSKGYQVTEEKCPQLFGRVQRTDYLKSQEDYAKFEITRLTGFKFDHGPAEMDGDELLAIFNAGVNLGRML
jgi:hypothetical protein